MAESTISARGQTTVPVEIRQSIGGVPGTRLVWEVRADGRLFVRVKDKASAVVQGVVKVPNTPSLVQFMQSSPMCAVDDLVFERDKSVAREVDL